MLSGLQIKYFLLFIVVPVSLHLVVGLDDRQELDGLPEDDIRKLFRQLPRIQISAHSTKEDTNSSGPKSPVILVPGYGGTRLEAKLDKPSVVRYFCDRKTDWQDLWVNVRQMLPYMIDCLIDNMRMEYDDESGMTRDVPGVQVRVKNPGHISSVEYLHDLTIPSFAYFGPISDGLVNHLGYKRQTDLRGAPYDFRRSPNEIPEYFEDTRKYTQDLYTNNGNKRVSFVCHSMGCTNVLYFLHHQSQTWKDTYVKRLISIAAPWGGTMAALRAVASGDDLGMPYLFNRAKLNKVQRSLSSTIFLFPNKYVYQSDPLITVNSSQSQPQNYYAHDLEQFFQDIQHPDGYKMWLNTRDLLGSVDAPGVEVWCLVGKGHKTLKSISYAGSFPDSEANEIYEDGDGAVSLMSASYCKVWSEEQTHPVFYYEYDSSHPNMLKDLKVINHIRKILDI